ncbi:HalOD1 output domain-containing protein [Haladaptatus salinisoli]|uniref:HalOD1 output domain-containing protein n=1 Tax=Haladaptatus salinisoli TaxID=2884876 RepID=UPI001D09F9E3|nr:HalOD1 output domain-containing protein [Haladaptatus salinisoli]
MIHQFSFDREQADSIVITISEAISRVTDTPMEEMPPLQETVDCDALEALIHSFDTDGMAGIGKVQFPFHGCTVRVDTTGTVQVFDGNRRLPSDDAGC